MRTSADLKKHTLLHLDRRDDWDKWLQAAGIESPGFARGLVLNRTREPVAPMLREKLKREAPARAGVPMRGTGAEQSVVGMKVLFGRPSRR